jgi:hypothetical protein
MKTKLHYVLIIAMIFFTFSSMAQNSMWNRIENTKDEKVIKRLNLNLANTQTFLLNKSEFDNITTSTTLRKNKGKEKGTIIELPGINGKIESFEIYEAPVFAPELSAKYPNIKSYVGVSLDSNGTRLRMSTSHNGVNTMISYLDKPTVYMEPVSKKSNEYIVYNRSAYKDFGDTFECETIEQLNESFNKNGLTSKVNEGGANNQTLQKFRIAASTTGEYTAYHGNEIDALAAINVSLNRVNEVFETDMAITFELIANTNLVIYSNGGSDPYSDHADNDNWNSELESTLNSVIGLANYDIGHLFGKSPGNGLGAGGNAGCIGCVCGDGKGSGYTTGGVPEGSRFDYVLAHEIGHQMGANHTFAFRTEGTGVNSEPGSGSTIMSYAGAGGVPTNDFIAPFQDSYYHFQSIKQILDNVNTKSCQTTEVIANNPPISDAGPDYNIPKGTAYILKGSATDADGRDDLTYCWEQIDSGVVTWENFGPTLSSGSMNRSLPPSALGDRYIPLLSSVMDGFTTRTNPGSGEQWETVSNVARTLNWALTVRDRSISSSTGGQSSYDTMQITVEDVNPFTVVNPVSWTQGNTETIEWNVGQTTNGTINCQNVNIYLSTSGGSVFETAIASNVPNNGSFTYTVPAIPDTQNARILIEAADNIFYDVNDFNFSISSTPDFFIANRTLNPIECKGTTASYTFDYFAINGFSENTVFSASNIPPGSTATFSPANLSTSGQVTLTFSNMNAVSQGNYLFSLRATAPSETKSSVVLFPFFNEQCLSSGTTARNTGITLVQFNTINQVSAKPSGYSDYRSISTDVNRNSSYNLTVNVNTVFSNVTVATKAWIDWNQNCNFNDPGEEYDLGDATGTLNGAAGNSPLNITVPANAVLGITEMRISAKNRGTVDGLPTPCETAFDGEVEDYTINVASTLNIEEFGFDNFAVYPNPNKGEFTVKLNGALSRNINIEVYDIRGRAIYKNRFKDTGDFNETINLNNAQAGLYILNVDDGVRKSTKKIVIE